MTKIGTEVDMLKALRHELTQLRMIVDNLLDRVESVEEALEMAGEIELSESFLDDPDDE